MRLDGAAPILRRFVGATLCISVLLLAVNFVMLGAWLFKGMRGGQPPADTVRLTAEGLTADGGGFALSAEAERQLKASRAWAMLLDASGTAVWSYALPDELPRVYSLADVARMSRHYLMDYPVFVWEHESGLLVVGYPKGSIAKYAVDFPVSWLHELPFRSVVLVIANLALALLLSLAIGALLIRSIRPLIRGIHALPHDRGVEIQPRGMLASLASSINATSALLQRKNAALKTRDEARSNWIAGISHDIRTPLSLVLGYASELEDSADVPSEQRRKAGIIRRQAEKLRSLVSDLNLVSMLEYEMQPLDVKPIRLAALARRAASDVLNNGLDERFALELDVPGERTVAAGDERLLLRAVLNLLHNSIDHNPQGCRIVLRTSESPERGTCSLIVADDGKGVAAGDLSGLLELPYASTQRRRAANGRGLGLPMVARIARAHGGELRLASSPEQGMQAEIELPAAPPPLPLRNQDKS